jgi:predicted enzyme related to lactoylglutathione lyase
MFEFSYIKQGEPMASTIKLIVFPVKDLYKAKNLYRTFLGIDPYVDSAYYVGYKVGDLEVGLDPNGQNVVSYTDVDDIERSLKELEATGAMVHMDVKNVGGGLLVAQVKDANGNILGLRQQSK